MEENNNYIDTSKKKAAIILKVLGLSFLAIGLTLTIIGVVDFFNSYESQIPPRLFALIIVGASLLFFGLLLTLYGFMGSINRYVIEQTAPIGKDAANYILKGTRNETVNTLKEATSAVASDLNKSKTIICPSCHSSNEIGAKFCFNCGASLTKTCLSCGEINDVFSNYCHKCGTKF